MANSPAALSSKISATVRHLLLRASAARATAISSTATFSLTGKPAMDHPSPNSTAEIHRLSKINGCDLRLFARHDWPVLFARRGPRKDDDDFDDVKDDFDHDDRDYDDGGYDDGDFDNIMDDTDDNDDYGDEEEFKPKRKKID